MNYRLLLTQLIQGQITPRSVVGTGYNNARQVASEWLRTQIHNTETQDLQRRIDKVHVASSGAAFSSITRAQRSKVFKQLIAGEYKTLNDSKVADYGVFPSAAGDGYEIFVVYQR